MLSCEQRISSTEATQMATIELEYFSPPQAAKLLGVAVDTIHLFIRSGKLKASNLGQAGHPRWKISRTAIEEFMNARSNSRPAARPKPQPAKTLVGSYTV
jgi:excisionase family DNA binding protein